MPGERSQRDHSRREIIRTIAGAGLAAPLAVAIPKAALAQVEAVTDQSGHPVVGVWFESHPSYAYAQNKYGYSRFHGDGVYVNYNPWMTFWLDSLGLGVGDPKLPATGLGVWRPTGERTIEATWRVAWGDTSSTLLMTFWGRGEVSENGEVFVGHYRATIVDASAAIVFKDAGSARMDRLRWEPYEGPPTPEATPET